MKKKFSKILGVGLTLALLASLLLTAVPVSALTQPTVILDGYLLSEDPVEYTIQFTLGEALDAGEDIIVAFPTGTDLSNVATGDTTLAATSGIGTDAFSGVTTSTVDVTGAPTMLITLPGAAAMNAQNSIGAGALVQVIIDDVINPPTPGDYTLDVSTDIETTAVTSNTYTIVPILPSDLPGIVQLFNPDGYFIDQETGNGAIDDMITIAGEDYTLEIGPGTYSVDTLDTADDGVTFVSTDGAELTIIELDINIYNDDTTLDGFTIRGEMWVDGVADDVLIENCIFEKDDAVDEMLIIWDSGSSGTVADSSFDTTEGSTDDVAIASDSDGLVVTGNSFTVDEDDVAVGTIADATITGNTFTGSSGLGVGVGGDDSDGVTIEGNTFDGLETAIDVEDYSNTPNVLIDGNDIMNCTGDAIVVWDVDDWVVITNNSITDTDEDYYALAVWGSGHEVWMLYNNITGNELNVYNDSGNDVDATHNWWGDADGPASDSICEDSGDIITWAWLGGPIELGTAVVAADWPSPDGVDAKDEAGVTISADDGADVFGAAVYDDNPFTAPPYPVLGDPIDVYVSEDNDLDGGDEVTIKLYDADITEDTVAYVWSELQGAWLACDEQGVSLFGGYLFVTVTDTTSPAIEDLAGIPIVLVEVPPVPPTLDAPVLTAPVADDDDVSLNPTFDWEAVAGADGYYFELADNADFVAPLVKLSGDMGRLVATAYHYRTELDYSTPYYWRVKAASGTVDGGNLLESGWVDRIFTTIAEPEPEAWMSDDGLTFDTREELEEYIAEREAARQAAEAAAAEAAAAAQPDITIEPPDVIVPLPAETPITPGWIYAIIGVGAVLVIAVIVLIVRTRRVA